MKTAIAIVVFLTGTSAFAQSAVEYLKEHPDAVAKYFEQSNAIKKERLQVLSQEITDVRSNLETVKKTPIRRSLKEDSFVKDGKLIAVKSPTVKEMFVAKIQTVLSEKEAEEKTLKDDANIIDSWLSTLPSRWKVGMIGRFRSGKVIQVVDANNALISPSGGDGSVNAAWFEIPTTGIVDGAMYRNSPHVFVITQTKQYKTVSGGTSTVFVVSALPEDWKWPAEVPADVEPKTEKQDK